MSMRLKSCLLISCGLLMMVAAAGQDPVKIDSTAKKKTKAIIYINDTTALRHAVNDKVHDSLDSLKSDITELKKLLNEYKSKQVKK